MAAFDIIHDDIPPWKLREKCTWVRFRVRVRVNVRARAGARVRVRVRVKVRVRARVTNDLGN